MIDTSVDVPPISNDSKRSKPDRAAVNRAPFRPIVRGIHRVLSRLLWKINIGEDVPEQLRSDLALEEQAIPRLNAQNLVEVFVRGADKAIWHIRETVADERGVVWSPWKSTFTLGMRGAKMRLRGFSSWLCR